MKLRAHHLLCLPNFIGEGYSNAFSANMAARKAQLKAEGAFTLVSGADEICAACPHRRGGDCESREKVARYDAALAGLLGLEAGRTYDAAALEERVRSEIFAAGRLGEICGDCEWFSLCEGLTSRSADHWSATDLNLNADL